MGEFTIHAYVPENWEKVNLWAWYAPDGGNAFDFWPGAEMTENGRGIFEASVPGWVNTVILSGNGGETQTDSIPIESRELWVSVDSDMGCVLSYVNPEIKLSAELPDDWHCPRVWAWRDRDGKNAFNIWPGIEMSREGKAWTAFLPRWSDRIIISSINEKHRSSEIAFEAGRDIFVRADDEDKLSLSYEPGETALPEKPAEEASAEKPREPEAEPEAGAEPETVCSSVPESASREMPQQEFAAGGRKHTGLLIAAAAVIAGIAAAVILRKKHRRFSEKF